MRIVCPSCQAAYDVPASVLAAGRTLRCARCSADFTPEIAAEPPVPAVRPVPEPAPPPALPMSGRLIPSAGADESVHRQGPRLAVAAGWVASLVVLAAMGWSFMVWRAPIARVWPASERMYLALGFK